MKVDSGGDLMTRPLHGSEMQAYKITFFNTMVIIYLMTSQLLYLAQAHQSTVLLIITGVSFSIGVLAAVASWLILWTRRKLERRVDPDANLEADTTRSTSVLSWQLLAPLLTGLYLCSFFILQTLAVNRCHGGSHVLVQYCNPHRATNGLPVESIMALVTLPILQMMTLPLPNSEQQLRMYWYMEVALALLSLSILACVHSIPFEALAPILLLAAAISVMLIDCNYQLWRRSFVVVNQSGNVATSAAEKETIDHQVRDMRNMIANVAHDLKTPLTSYTSGIDHINLILQDIQTLSDTDSLTQEACQEQVALLRDIVSSMSNTNSFMTMAINRCIDFTKTCNNIKLKPALETIDLQATVRLPLRIISDLQSKLKIELAPVIGLTSHIITDKHWLQENLLCLLSNAVKYSHKGTVTIRISLQTHDALDRMQHCAYGDNLSAAFIESTSAGTAFLGASAGAGLHSSAFVGVGAGAAAIIDDDNSSDPRSIESDRVLGTSLRQEALQQLSTFLNMKLEKSSSLSSLSSLCDYGEMNGFVLVEVEDTGIGLTEEAAANLFSPFQQAQRLAGGTGLGLYSLAKRMDALHGHYGVRKRNDGLQGSVFWFALPFRPDFSMNFINESSYYNPSSKCTGSPLTGRKEFSARTIASIAQKDHCTKSQEAELRMVEPAPTTSAATAASTVATNIGAGAATNAIADQSPKILLVDDSLSIIKMTSQLLKKKGYVVDTVDNGAEALELILDSYRCGKHCTYELMLIDLQMPVMDGVETVRRLRAAEAAGVGAVATAGVIKQQQQLLHLPVICVSADNDEETIKSALTAGADAFITKPFAIATFISTYEKLPAAADWCRVESKDA